MLEEYGSQIQKIDDYPRTTHTILKISYDQLGALAKSFLQLCSFLHHKGIYRRIFESAALASVHYHPDEGFDEVGKDAFRNLNDILALFLTSDRAWDTVQFHRVVGELRSYSLLQFDNRNQSYSIHPLVHE